MAEGEWGRLSNEALSRMIDESIKNEWNDGVHYDPLDIWLTEPMQGFQPPVEGYSQDSTPVEMPSWNSPYSQNLQFMSDTEFRSHIEPTMRRLAAYQTTLSAAQHPSPINSHAPVNIDQSNNVDQVSNSYKSADVQKPVNVDLSPSSYQVFDGYQPMGARQPKNTQKYQSVDARQSMNAYHSANARQPVNAPYNQPVSAYKPDTASQLDGAQKYQSMNAYQSINALQLNDASQPINMPQNQTFYAHQPVGAPQYQPVGTYQQAKARQPTHTNPLRQDSPLYGDRPSSQKTFPPSQIASASTRKGKTQASFASSAVSPSNLNSVNPQNPASPVPTRKRKRTSSDAEIDQQAPSTATASAPSSSPTSSSSETSFQDQDKPSDSVTSTSEDEEPVSKKSRRVRKPKRATDSQGGSSGKSYAKDLQGRPEVGVLPPRNIQLSAVEILSFFPRCLHHPDVVLRLVKHGWTRIDIAKVQLHAVNLLDYDTMHKVDGRTQKQITEAGKLVCNLKEGQSWNIKTNYDAIPAYNDLTAAGWRTRHDLKSSWEKVDFEVVKLYDIARPVFESGYVPQGDDRLLFTECLNYAYNNPDMNLTTDDCDLIIKRHGWPTSGNLDGTHDSEALLRFRAAVPTPPETAEAEAKRLTGVANYRANKKHRA